MALGPRDTTSLVLMTGWDATALQNYRLSDGTTIATVQAQLNAALTALNGELFGGLWGGLVSFTDRPDLEYRIGGSNGFEEHTEYGRPDSKRADIEGHMLPYKKYDRGLGWTWDYLEDARLEQIQADIADAVKDARDLWRQKLLARLLKRGDDSGANNGLGSGGLSPGFATTAGSTGVDYVPPSYGGTAFANTHEHYVAIAGGAWTNAVFIDAKAELMEHGHLAPYIFLISSVDAAEVSALTDFTPAAMTNIRYGITTDLATISMDEIAPGVYPIGVIHDFVVYVVPGMPEHYGFGYKSYGNLSQRNPLRVRTTRGMSRPAVMAAPDPRNGSPAHPLQYMMLQFRFGVGVADRTNGTARYVNNATWADGTPT
jgi:hypothetical protein